MGMFLPESMAQPQDGVTQFTPSSPETTTDDIALMQRVLAAASQNPNLIPTDFMAYVADYIQTQRLNIPIGQVTGFTPYANTIQAQQAAISSAQMKAYANTSGSLSLGNNTFGSGAGPSISGLPAGKYIILASFDSSGVNGPQMALSTGLTVTQNPLEQLITFASTTTITSTLSGTGGGAGGTISNCWILALNYSN
jgi:hypothetical protein